MSFPPIRELHQPSRTADGRKGVLRQLRWDDLEACLAFATGLAEEYAVDVHHGTLLAKAPTRSEEMEWLGKMLTQIEKGMVVSVVAEVEGAFAGNSEVTRGGHPDISLHGTLGIAVNKPFRGLGVGTLMLKVLMAESRAAGLKTVELRALATNAQAISLYEKVGFKRVGVIKAKIQRRGMAIDEMVMALEL